METSINSAGYDLYEVQTDSWVLSDRIGGYCTGTFKNVVKGAILMGFEMKEIEIAVEEMIKHGHDASHFGMYKGFIYTFQRENTDKRAG